MVPSYADPVQPADSHLPGDGHRLLELGGGDPAVHGWSGGLEAGAVLVHDVDVCRGRYLPANEFHHLSGARQPSRQDQVPDQEAAFRSAANNPLPSNSW